MIKYGIFLKIGNYQFTTATSPRGIVNEVKITSSWEDFTDTCTITIPKKLYYKSKSEEAQPVINPSTKEPVFKSGEAVTLGVIFNGYLQERFRGQLHSIQPKRPMVIECQDGMRTLKHTTSPSITLKDATLPTLLDKILPRGTSFQAEDLQLGLTRIPKRYTVAQVLEWLKKSYGINSFMKDDILIAGFPYLTFLQADLRKAAGNDGGAAYPVIPKNDSVPDPVIIQYGKNLIDDSNLTYVTRDQMKYKVTVVVYYPVNSPRHPDRLEGKIPKVDKQVKFTDIAGNDPDGGQRTFYMYDVDQDAALAFGAEKLKTLTYDGFTGNFTTFLVPRIRQGETVRIIHRELPDQEGIYWVKRVVSSYGMDGGRQRVELDRKVTSGELKL